MVSSAYRVKYKMVSVVLWYEVIFSWGTLGLIIPTEQSLMSVPYVNIVENQSVKLENFSTSFWKNPEGPELTNRVAKIVAKLVTNSVIKNDANLALSASSHSIATITHTHRVVKCQSCGRHCFCRAVGSSPDASKTRRVELIPFKSVKAQSPHFGTVWMFGELRSDRGKGRNEFATMTTWLLRLSSPVVDSTLNADIIPSSIEANTS
ncbi:hypothetical protein TNCV_2274151 [Trichonephila clavipes]|nr:hypothetical protein TNCV_2274151 [Trichonephila clavipes]